MADKNKDESVRNANPYDLRDHFEFPHAIVVPEELKKSMLGELSVYWDFDDTDEKQRIYMGGLFK
ncbi:hypothetical protein D8674_021500 [Pyrus ussuriensis x Pyrus communis]|uniref:Uncharacterized protein n=1 Tax=Pyrus ussuriensis x Pyrus communis TaxID=2448454 RepID=A0A5N5GMR6_9ROSA|nr:hypothetical protein D8674_021500 [Pyrus ussuriensis x Pyrus communis]